MVDLGSQVGASFPYVLAWAQIVALGFWCLSSEVEGLWGLQGFEGLGVEGLGFTVYLGFRV